MAEATKLDIVQTVFKHRLKQADMDRILAELSSTDRDELMSKIGNLLDRISALVDVYNKVSDSLSLDVLLPRLMAIVTEALHSDRSTLFLNDTDTNELFSRVAQGDAIGEIRFPNHLGIAGSVFTSGEAVIIPDAYADPRFNQDVDKKTGYRTRNILCAPLICKGKCIGVTQVLNKLDGDFDEDDLTFLGALTGQASSALENAQLFEKVEKARKEESRLLEVTSAIASELNLDTLLGKIVGVTTEMLDADRTSLFVHDPKTNELWSRVAEGLAAKEIRIPAAAGIAGACFTSGRIINIPDAYQDPRFNQAFDKKTGYRTRTILCMPVVNKDGARVGVIQVLNKKSGPFAPQDENRLRAFAAQAAIALENARLFEDVNRERNYNESILKSLSNGVISLDVDHKIIKINTAISHILKWDRPACEGKPISELFAGDPNRWILDSLEKTSKSNEVDLTMDAEIEIAGGERISVNLSNVPLIDLNDNAIGCLMIVEDISKEKRLKGTMAKYMSKEVAEKLLQKGEDVLGGSAQEASVLFSDIRSFTTISEELGARETVAMLNEYFTEMIDVIMKYSGILDKYIGDAIMAKFGVPFPTPEDANNAVNTATEMIRALRKLNESRALKNHKAIRIGVGISTGELFAGNIGSPKRVEYTVIGDTVNLASRLEGITKYYGVQVVFSEYTVIRLKKDIRYRELDLIRVKGKNLPVGIYEGLDHYTEETFPNMAGTLAAFESGLRNYRRRNWPAAVRDFEQALALHPADGPSKLYLDRCRHYFENPPAENWDGVWVMTSK